MEKLTCVRNSLVAITEELQLRGLMGNISSDDAIQTKTETPVQNKESRFQNHKSKNFQIALSPNKWRKKICPTAKLLFWECPKSYRNMHINDGKHLQIG